MLKMAICRPLVVGISGTTNGGKTSLCQKLIDKFPRCHVISMDEYFYEPDDTRIPKVPELNHGNWEVMEAVDMKKLYLDVRDRIQALTKDIHSRQTADMTESRSTTSTSAAAGTVSTGTGIVQGAGTDTRAGTSGSVGSRTVCGGTLLIVEGILVFNYPSLTSLFDKKYFLTLDKQECLKRRNTRVYVPPDPQGYFDLVVWPYYIKNKQALADQTDIVYLDGTKPREDILSRVMTEIKSLMT